MSRRKPDDNSATVSLFPFLAVLLCTMGALLVVLVGMSRSARNAVLDRVTSVKNVVENDVENSTKLEEVKLFRAKLNEVRADAEAKLRKDQQRLSQVESHMRNLQDELKKLVLANAELDAIEEEHYDDRKQTEQEVARLQQLIAENQAAVDKLKTEGTKRKRSYALVPYEGPSGTTRRPIYIECCKEGVVLQPEGTLITRQDLRPPLGSGNPLAAALRAARDHYMQNNPAESGNRDVEPYAMLLIRPEGAHVAGFARKAIEAADFDFGFEPVETHWELNYGVADPVLAHAEQKALEQARARQALLAAAAPRAYSNPDLGSSGRFEYDEQNNMSEGLMNGGDNARQGGVSYVTAPRNRVDRYPAPDIGSVGNAKSGRGEISNLGDGTNGASDSPPGVTAPNDDPNSPSGPGGPSAQPSGAPPNSTMAGPSAASGASAPPTTEQNNGVSSGSADQNNSTAPGSPNDVNVHHQPGSDADQPVAPGWKTTRKNARAVAVRRSIRIIVRDHQVAIVSENARAGREELIGKTVPFEGDTVESMDRFISTIREEVDSWGIAGQDLYWKPVLDVYVGPNGQRRADDLVRLLEKSDIEVKSSVTANTPQGNSRATR